MRPLLALALAVSATALAAADWTDRAEYDLVLSIRAEATAAKRLTLLEQWKAKYPASPHRMERSELFLATYASAGDTPRMIEVVKEMAAERPDHPTAGYWCSVLVPGSTQTAAELWNRCEKAFAVQKPATKESVLLAWRATGWIHWQRGDLPKAEAEFSAYLKEAPENTEMAAWLGAVLALQQKPEKTVASLWHLARAGRQSAAMLETVYLSYHGSADGLAEMRTASAASVFPPADFTVESAAAIAARRKQEEIARSQPDPTWSDLRKRLEAPDGAVYFSSTLRDKPLPKMKGVLAKFSVPGKPEELVLAMENPGVEDLILKLTAPLAADPMLGQVMEFEGVAESFTAIPFVLIVRTDPAKVSR